VLATACSLGTCCLRRATKRKHNEIQCVRILQAPTDFGIETDGRRSERCQEDVEAELLDSLKSVGMADGIRTLISLRNLDSDLRRRYVIFCQCWVVGGRDKTLSLSRSLSLPLSFSL